MLQRNVGKGQRNVVPDTPEDHRFNAPLLACVVACLGFWVAFAFSLVYLLG